MKWGISTFFCVKKWYFHCPSEKIIDWGTRSSFSPVFFSINPIKNHLLKKDPYIRNKSAFHQIKNQRIYWKWVFIIVEKFQTLTDSLYLVRCTLHIVWIALKKNWSRCLATLHVMLFVSLMANLWTFSSSLFYYKIT